MQIAPCVSIAATRFVNSLNRRRWGQITNTTIDPRLHQPEPPHSTPRIIRPTNRAPSHPPLPPARNLPNFRTNPTLGLLTFAAQST